MDLVGTDEQKGIDAAVSWLRVKLVNSKVVLIGESHMMVVHHGKQQHLVTHT